MSKTVKAAGALTALLVLLIGIPVALVVFYGNPLPTSLPSGSDISALLTSTETTAFALFVAVWVGWIAWGTFAMSVVLELAARARQTPTPRLRGLSLPQGAAALLIATIAGGLGAPAALASPEAPAPVVQTVQQDTPTAPQQGPETTKNTPATEETAAPEQEEDDTQELVITVKPGDTAWDLAQTHLGDGERWREIVKANDGKIQHDGGALRVGEVPYLEPGWELVMPGVPASTPEPEDTEATTVTVKPGQSLSSIARDHLGDPGRWQEIYDASTDIEQPGGYHLEDPNQIDVGWTLRIPSPAPAAQTEAETAPSQQDTKEEPSTPQPATETPQVGAELGKAAAEAVEQMPVPLEQEESAIEEAAVAAPQPAAPAQSETPETEEDASANVPWAGVGSILAASMLSALVARRLHTQRKRRAGQRIPEAARVVSLDEVRLTQIEDPTVLGFVDRSLRTLAALQLRDHKTLPDIRLARLTDTHLELYAAAAHELPEPFEASDDPAAWLLPRTAPLADDETIADIVAPYPALVTIGTDSDDNQILVDLEHLAALGIQASPAASMPVMRALTVSLATSQWADDLTITTVGICPELEDALSSGRLAYAETVSELLDTLEAKVARDQETLTELGHDSAQHARHAQEATDLWGPEIIIIGADLSLTEQRRLQAIVDTRPQIAVAVISSDDRTELSDWRMHIESLEAATLEPLGMALRPQHLTDEDYDRVLAALDGATHTEQVPDQPAEEVPALRALPSIAATEILTAEQRDTAVDVPSEHPYLRLLGPIEVLGATGPMETKRLAELTETVAYIHLRPGARDTDFRADLWRKPISNSTRLERASRTRKWLGTTSDGEKYLGRAAGADGAYTFTEHIRSDWQDLQETAEQLTDATAEQLADALKLVRGRPFEDAARNRFGWASMLHHQMLQSIGDIAHELAQRALEAGDTETALWAAQQGLLADPLLELLWRDRLRAAAHDPELHQTLSAELDAVVASIADDEGYTLSPETEALMSPAPSHRQIAI